MIKTKHLATLACIAFSTLFLPLSVNAQKIEDSKTFISIAVLKAKQGKKEELRKALMALIAPTRKEKGCLEYILFEGVEDGDFYMREAFKTQADFDAHIASPYFQSFKSKFDELLSEPVHLIKLKKVSN